jgi:hypothetical protein
MAVHQWCKGGSITMVKETEPLALSHTSRGLCILGPFAQTVILLATILAAASWAAWAPLLQRTFSCLAPRSHIIWITRMYHDDAATRRLFIDLLS